MRPTLVLSLTALSCALTLAHADRARACGGCFHPPTDTPSVVTGHRMAFAISPARTVLWDQIQYSGSPTDFSWVLPVGPGAELELSHDAWFESLDAFTTTQVEAPQLECTLQQGTIAGGSGCACGSASGNDAALAEDTANGGAMPTPGVTVLHEGTVGPYETATLHSTDPKALENWLAQNQYVLPDDIRPIIDAYVAEGSDFIALRLKPGAEVREMSPVRVVTPGASAVLPLRMVAAGTGANVAITLWVISEGRYGPASFPEASLDLSQLAWDWKASVSNYGSLRDAALATNDGRSWLPTFALGGAAMTSPSLGPNGPTYFQVTGSPGYGYGTLPSTLTDLYFAQAAADAGEPNQCGTVSSLVAAEDLVSESAAGSLDCQGYDDVLAALIGLHPKDVWVTRLEANLPRAALADDLTLAASSAQAAIPAWKIAAKSVNPPCLTPATVLGFDRGSLARQAAALVAAFGLLARRALRRRSRRTSAPDRC
jgi:hypothetical protein